MFLGAEFERDCETWQMEHSSEIKRKDTKKLYFTRVKIAAKNPQNTGNIANILGEETNNK